MPKNTFRTIVLSLVFGYSSHVLAQSAEWKAIDAEVRSLSSSGQYDRGILAAQRAMEVAIQSEGVDGLRVADSASSLAWLYVQKGNYKQAEAFYAKALSIREKSPDADPRLVARNLFGLAGVHDKQNHYGLAEDFYRRATEAVERTFGPTDPYTAGTLHNFAAFYYDRKEFSKAEGLYRRALAAADSVPEPNRSTVMSRALRTNLATQIAEACRKQGKFEDAFEFYERARASVQVELGRFNRQKLIMYLEALVPLYKEIGKTSQAELLEKEISALRATP